MMRRFICFLIFLALFLQVVPAASVGMATSLSLSANPDTIVADGRSVTTISAEIRDSSGNLMPDGTQISFSTSLGTIQNTVTTIAGVARARLTSGTVVGTASVSAWVTQGGAVGQIKVEMLEPGTVIPRESFITVSSGSYLVYDGARMVIYASGGAKISHRGLNIDADEAQLDIQLGTLKLRRGTASPIVLSRDKKELIASLVYYRLNDMKGFAVVEGESGKVERVSFRGSDLATEPVTDEFPPNYFDFVDLSDSQVLIKASSITIKPKDEIHFRRAQVYMEGKKIISVPLQVIPLTGDATQTSHYVGWGTNGLRLDLPFYYSLNPTSTGSVHLRRGQPMGWGFYSGNNGWSLDMVEDYTTNNGAEGNFTVNRIGNSDWGLNWHHSQLYDSGSRVYSYLEFPSHKDLFGTLSLSKPIGKASLGVNLYGSKYQGQTGNMSTDVYLQSAAKPIGNGFASYMLLGRTSYASNISSGSNLGAGLQTQIYGKPVDLGGKTNLNTSFTFGHDWGGIKSGFTVNGTASLMKQFARNSNCGLIYTYNQDRYSIANVGRHRLSASMMYAPSKKLQAQLISTYTIDQPLSSTFADLSYRFMPKWRINVLQTFQKYGTFGYGDTEFALGRSIGENEFAVVWSKSKHQFRFEFNAARF